jgi:rhamnulokinase
VHAGSEEATLLGNLLVQAISLGEIASLTEARDIVAASVVPRTYEPRDSAEWREARARFAATVALHKLQVDA